MAGEAQADEPEYGSSNGQMLFSTNWSFLGRNESKVCVPKARNLDYYVSLLTFTRR